LSTLRAAGVDPEVVVSGLDEDAVTAVDPAELAEALAVAKANVVAALPASADAVVVGCDSILDLDGAALGKPTDAAEARARWRRMRGRSGVLVTGHCVIDVGNGVSTTGVARTVVHFADVADAEIDAYVATGEPLQVAGAFTIDGLGGPFVRGVEGDPHNVVGLSLPLLRELLLRLGHAWPSLWRS
jgi:septum formation protein